MHSTSISDQVLKFGRGLVIIRPKPNIRYIPIKARDMRNIKETAVAISQSKIEKLSNNDPYRGVNSMMTLKGATGQITTFGF